jgi:adenosine/AMP kinase
MELLTVRIDKPATTNFILGQTHFIRWASEFTGPVVMNQADRSR